MTARLIALLFLLAVIAVLLLLPLRPTPLMVDPTPAGVVWLYRYEAPPQFCTAPLPLCPGGRCEVNKNKEQFT